MHVYEHAHPLKRAECEIRKEKELGPPRVREHRDRKCNFGGTEDLLEGL